MSKLINTTRMGRRSLLKAAGLSGMLTGLPVAAMAGSSTAPLKGFEQANEDLVTQFCKDWALQDVEKLIPYLSEDIEYHVWEGGLTVNGHDEFRKGMKGFMSGMKEIRWEIHRSQVMGDIVLNERTDYFIMENGKNMPRSPFEVVGVFLVRDGVIKYWKDYGVRGDDV